MIDRLLREDEVAVEALDQTLAAQYLGAALEIREGAVEQRHHAGQIEQPPQEPSIAEIIVDQDLAAAPEVIDEERERGILVVRCVAAQPLADQATDGLAELAIAGVAVRRRERGEEVTESQPGLVVAGASRPQSGSLRRPGDPAPGAGRSDRQAGHEVAAEPGHFGDEMTGHRRRLPGGNGLWHPFVPGIILRLPRGAKEQVIELRDILESRAPFLDRPLPAYAYRPGRGPHPRRSPGGHSFGAPEAAARAHSPADWRRDEAYLRGCDLHDAGYFWEAHESWEAGWHARERQGDAADLLKALIQTAAAHLKSLMGEPRGVELLADKSHRLLVELAGRHEESFMGMSIGAFAMRRSRWFEWLLDGCRGERPAFPYLHDELEGRP